MEKAVSGNAVTLIDRRLHPVRLGISQLANLLEGGRSGGSVTIDHDTLYSIVTTLEIFMEDFETQCLGGSSAKDKKADAKADSPRVTQTRVG
ncbi:MAG: hypothetical protein ACYTG7_10855 [Planctomycetota bacterium]|jgi:hypothetical protein